VNNTDAEGRLTLADALWFAQEKAGAEVTREGRWGGGGGCWEEVARWAFDKTPSSTPNCPSSNKTKQNKNHHNHNKQKAIVDIATLTGACMIALGNEVAGLFTPSDAAAAAVNAAAKAAGEKVWRARLAFCADPLRKEPRNGRASA
jgi:leucyl aminopeptidase